MSFTPVIADPSVGRAALTDRKLIDVAVGVLFRSDGAFLLTSRPRGKPYDGYWEFPGGKQEVGESIQQTLKRELQEELGINVVDACPWKEQIVDYPHALVRLNFFKVFAWQGELQMREGQSFSWEHLPVKVSPILPGSLPVLKWIACT